MKKKVLAHRWIWEHTKGAIPAGICVLHECDNPPCVNPNHLFLGTVLDNVQDMDKKGRRKFKITSKLTADQISEIRSAPKTWGYQTRLAKKFGVDQSTISDVINGVSFKN